MPNANRTLIVVAAPQEAAAVQSAFVRGASPTRDWALFELDERHDLVQSGVGKANAAGALAAHFDPDRHARVLSCGLAGALPESGLIPGDSVAATASVFADEGVQTPTGFLDLVALGFPPAPGLVSAIPADPTWLRTLAALTDRAGPIATVSTCSGTDALALVIAQRTGAVAEAMEGAAVALAAARLAAMRRRPVPFAELRIISNRTGDRDRQGWDLRRAFSALTTLLGRVACSTPPPAPGSATVP